MVLYNITNVDKLYTVLDRCTGNVDMVLPDGKSYNWKNNRQLVKALSATMPEKKINSMRLTLHDKADMGRMLNYLMEAC